MFDLRGALNSFRAGSGDTFGLLGVQRVFGAVVGGGGGGRFHGADGEAVADPAETEPLKGVRGRAVPFRTPGLCRPQPEVNTFDPLDNFIFY